MNGRATALAIAGLALFMLPSAQAGPFASLLAAEARIADAHLDGELEGTAWFGPDEGPPVSLSASPGSGIDLPGLSVSAARASVTIHHSERYAVVEGAPIEPTTWTLANLTAVGAQADLQYARLVAVPASAGSARLGLDTPALQVLPGPDGTQRHDPIVWTAPAAHIDTGASLLLPKGEGTLRITGSVRLILTGIDLALASDAGSHDLHTRRDVDGAEAQAFRSTYAARSIVHEAVLDLEEAVVVLPAAEAFVRSAVVSSGGTWSFERASGAVSGAGDVTDETVALAGELQAAVSRHPTGLLEVALSGSPAEVSIAGRTVAVASGPRDPSTSTLLLSGLGLAVVLVAAYVSFGQGRFRRLDHAMDRQDYARALGLSRGFSLHPWLREDAALVAAICLLALGRPADAGARLLGRVTWTVARRPMRDFLLARAEAALGRQDEAARRLAQSLVAEPSLLPEAQADPLLSVVLRAVRPSVPPEAYA